MNVAIAGATGLVGSECLVLLQNKREVAKIEVFGRRKVEMPSKAIFIETDFVDFRATGPIDAGICSLGTTLRKAGSQENFFRVDHDFVLSFAKHCLDRGAKKFVIVSALGADPKSRVFYNRVKGEAENALKVLDFESLIILRPSLLLGDRQEHRPAEKIASLLAPLLSPLMVGPLRAGRPINAKTVAKHAVEWLCKETSKQQIILNEDILSF